MADTVLTVVEEEPEDRWSLDDWLEQMADAAPGGPCVFGSQQASVSEVIRIEAHRPGGLNGTIRSCLQQILGYSKADHDNYALLRPAVPVAHPSLPWLWADVASVQKYGPLGNEEFVGSKAGTFKPKAAGTDGNFAVIGGADGLYRPEFTSNYGMALVTVRFSYFPWLVYTEDDLIWDAFIPGEEWRRMCVMSERRPRLDLIVAEGTDQGKYYFSEREAGSDRPEAGPSSTAFSGGVYVRKSSTTYTVCWKQVAEEYLCGPYDLDSSDKLIMPLSARFDRYLGSVNQFAIWGQPAQTLLFADWRTERYPQPVRVVDQDGYPFAPGLIAHDVYLTFEKTDPPRAASVENHLGVEILDPADRLRGHQVAPYRPDVDKKWYGVTAGTSGAGGTGGTSSGARKFEELDHRDLFRHANDPSFPLPP